MNQDGSYGVSAGKRDQIGIFFKKKFLSKIDVDLIIWFRTFVISKKNFLSIWSLFPALTLYYQRDQVNQDGYYQRNQANPYIYQRNQVKSTNHKLTTKKPSEIIKKL